MSEQAEKEAERYEVGDIVWYARGGGIAKAGPFPDQVSAFDAMRLAPHYQTSDFPFPADVSVWPERLVATNTKDLLRAAIRAHEDASISYRGAYYSSDPEDLRTAERARAFWSTRVASLRDALASEADQ